MSYEIKNSIILPMARDTIKTDSAASLVTFDAPDEFYLVGRASCSKWERLVSQITLTPYMVLPLFATRFAAYADIKCSA